jgi:hypothetical protein
MNKKKSFIIRHRFLLVSLLCLFGVCVVAQVKPAAGQQKKVEKKSDDSAKNKKGTAKKKPVDKRKRVDLLHADEAQADKLLRTGCSGAHRFGEVAPRQYVYVLRQCTHLRKNKFGGSV